MLLDKEDLRNGKELIDSLMADAKLKDYFIPEDRFQAYIVGGLDFELAAGRVSEYQYAILLINTIGEEAARERMAKMKRGKG